MPFSPLIRPMSPLQTQSAPSLPAPYNLADAILGASSTTVVPEANGETRRSSASPQSSPAPRAAAPAFHRLASTTTPHSNHTPEDTGSGGNGGAEQTRGHSPQLSPSPSRQRAHETGGGRHSPHRTFVPSPATGVAEHRADKEEQEQPYPSLHHPRAAHAPFTSAHSSSAADTTATAATASPAAHPYDSSHAASRAGEYRAQGQPWLARNHSPHASHAGVSAKKEHERSAVLLRDSTAHVAVAASHPSYGTALLRKGHSTRGERETDARRTSLPRRSASPASLPSNLVDFFLLGPRHGPDGTSPSPSSRAAESASRPQHSERVGWTKKCAGAVDVGPTRDDGSDFGIRIAARESPQLSRSSNQYRGTAVSSRTGRLYTIAIEATPLDGEDEGEAADRKTHNHHKSDRVIQSVLYNSQGASCVSGGDEDDSQNNDDDDDGSDDGGQVFDRSSRVGGVAEAARESLSLSPRFASSSKEGSPLRRGAASGVERSGTTSSLLYGVRQRSHKSTSPSSPSLPPPPPQQRQQETITTTTDRHRTPSPPRYAPRFVHPALDDCSRLLREIETQNPLMRRCLTPPRPLASRGWRSQPPHEGASLLHPEADADCLADDDTVRPLPQRRLIIPMDKDAPAAYAASQSQGGQRRSATEARRLYHWDALAAAEDLTFMHGPFQQSAERFAASTARQLHRLREAGRQRYGAAVRLPSSLSAASTRHLSSASAPSFSLHDAALPSPMEISKENCMQSSMGGGRRGAVATRRKDESPSGRLRRLLRETEAAFPVFWRATYGDGTPPSPSPRKVEATEAKEEEGTEVDDNRQGRDGDSPLFTTPSHSTIHASHGGTDGMPHSGTVGGSAMEQQQQRSALTVSGAKTVSSLSFDELPLRLTVTALTPPRPPPPQSQRHRTVVS